MNDRISVLGCRIDRLTLAETVARCGRALEGDERVHQVSVNAAKLVARREDPRLRAIIDGCELVNPDGVSVVWASRLLGDPLPERVTGIDLMERLLEVAERRGYPVYLLGTSREMLERAVSRVRARHPGLRLAGWRDGYFEPPEDDAVCAAIRAAAPKLLFVAMGSPRTEHWLGERRRDLGVPFVMGVGGALDVIAGKVRRAPPLLQRLGLEWLYRLVQEPRRLIRRNLVSLTFTRLVLGEYRARRGA